MVVWGWGKKKWFFRGIFSKNDSTIVHKMYLVLQLIPVAWVELSCNTRCCPQTRVALFPGGIADHYFLILTIIMCNCAVEGRKRLNFMQLCTVYALLHYGGIYYLMGILSVYANWPIQSPSSCRKPPRIGPSSLSFSVLPSVPVMAPGGPENTGLISNLQGSLVWVHCILYAMALLCYI